MKLRALFAAVIVTSAFSVFAHAQSDREAVERASMQYIEGFYEGDPGKLAKALDTELYKFGFWQEKDSDTYENAGQMTYEEALAYAANVKKSGRFPGPDAPRSVEVLDIGEKIAMTKVVAWWGIDYMLLAKNDGQWKIRQILWEGPKKTASPTPADQEKIANAGYLYIDGFYKGDTAKLSESLRPAMFKFGFGYDQKSRAYRPGSRMTFDQAIAFAESVAEKKSFPRADAPREVEILDAMNHTAAIKVTAYWGVDYMLLSRNGDGWMIEQVLWAGVPKGD